MMNLNFVSYLTHLITTQDGHMRCAPTGRRRRAEYPDLTVVGLTFKKAQKEKKNKKQEGMFS
jgi:hypothetical protein